MFSRRYIVSSHSKIEFSSVPTSMDPRGVNRRGGSGPGGAGAAHGRLPPDAG